MPLFTVRRIKGGTTHFAAAFGTKGNVTRWEADPAAAKAVDEAAAKAVVAHHTGRVNAGRVELVTETGKVAHAVAETIPPAEPPPHSALQEALERARGGQWLALPHDPLEKANAELRAGNDLLREEVARLQAALEAKPDEAG
jgi:hypothetical protein